MTERFRPVILAVAPNGARLTKADHPNLPMTPAEPAGTLLGFGRRTAKAEDWRPAL